MRLKNICKVFSVVAALTLVGCGGQKQKRLRQVKKQQKPRTQQMHQQSMYLRQHH